MAKKWFIQLNGRKIGPFTKFQLKKNRWVTPDTLVWREGFADWTPLRFVPELADLFKDKKSGKQPDFLSPVEENLGKDELALTISGGIPPFVWILLILLLVVYIIHFILK